MNWRQHGCLLNASETEDTDGDGVGDILMPFQKTPMSQPTVMEMEWGQYDAFLPNASETEDTDGDGVGDNFDMFPDDPNESADSDGDGIGNNAEISPGTDLGYRQRF